jgi:hypothetical protein
VCVCVCVLFPFSRSHHLLFILAFFSILLTSLFLAIDKWVLLASSVDYLVGKVCFHSLMEGTCQHLPKYVSTTYLFITS